jgi:hypothetical protein
MKILHRLKPRVKLLTDFYVFDTETGVDAHYCEYPKKLDDRGKVIIKKGVQWLLHARPESFKFGVVYGHNYNKTFYSREEMLLELKTERFKKKKVFAHNLGNFDGSVMFDNIASFDPHAIFNGSRFISCTNGVCIFADSINIFVGQSIEKIGKQLGIKKPALGNKFIAYTLDGTDYFLPYFSPDGITSDELNRCHQDCVILWEALVRSFEFSGDIKITRASLAMTLFRRRYQKHHIEHNENTAYFWDSYYGGRTEAFKIGNTNATVYDVKSMYAWAMKETLFPNPKHLKVETNVNTELFTQRFLPNYEGCVYAEVFHSHIWCGLLPVKANGKLLFPVGNLSGCWNFNELRFALETGYVRIKNIQKVVYAERMASPFTEYIDDLFILKTEAEIKGDEFMRDEYKRDLTNLYGKFAQRIDEETIYLHNIEKQYDEILYYQKIGLFKKLVLFNSQRLDAFLIIGNTKNVSINHAIPSFASYITSGARVKMAKKLLACEGNKPVYCDTDSLAVENNFGIESESFLGGWELEKGKIIYQVNGLKNYKFRKWIEAHMEGDKWIEAYWKDSQRLKGVPDNAKQSQPNHYFYYNLSKTKESLRRNFDAGVMMKRTKIISGKYDKREVLENGDTKPLVFI